MKRVAVAVALALTPLSAGCAAPTDHDRAVVEARSCLALVRRAGREGTGIDPADFAAALDHYRQGTAPYSTLQPFLRACRPSG